MPKRRVIRTRHAIASIAALALIASVVAISIFNTRRNLGEFTVLVRHRQAVLELGRLVECLQDAQTNARGYLITGDELFYLPSYENAYGLVTAELDLLDGMLTDELEPEHLHAARLLTEAWRSEAQRLIDRHKAGVQDGAQSVIENRERELMDRLRAKIHGLRVDRAERLAAADVDTVRSLKRTNLAITVCGGTALAGAAVFSWMLFLHLRGLDAQHALRIQREAALRAEREKSEFLAVMSHEIRTPMNSILGFGELLHDSAENPRDRKFAAAILSSGNALLTLLNDILDLSRIEAGRIEFHSEAVDLADLAHQLELLFTHRAEEKGLRYQVEVDATVPAMLTFDPLRVRQVLLNLVGNALKFTSEGSVRVHIGPFQRQNRSESGVLRFSVTDTGIGIPKERQHDIFRPFFQVDSKTRRRFQGCGLGLSISRQLVAMMGGALTVESQPGEGSCFRVAVPVQLAWEAVVAPTETVAGQIRERPAPPATTGPGWDLAAHSEAEWRSLLQLLRGPLAEEAERLAAVVPAKATLDFAKRLDAKADHACWPLMAYAAALAAQVEAFETEAAAARLRAFHRLPESLAAALAGTPLSTAR